MPDEVTPQQRRTTLSGITLSTLVTAALWYALLRFLPSPGGAEPLATAIACCALAALLTLAAGVDAIAHERLVTPAIDPLAGFETRRMRINHRYLQNTLEQYVVYAAGLLALQAYTSPRVLVIVTIVWVLTRWAFWIGYHRNSLLRAIGAPGMMQSMIVLLYVAYCAGRDSYGQGAGVALLIVFAGIEAVLFRSVLRKAQ